MLIIAVDTLIYLSAALFAVVVLSRRLPAAWTWIAVGALNFAALSALEWSLGGPGTLVRHKVAGLPVVQILKQCGTGFFLAMGLLKALRAAPART